MIGKTISFFTSPIGMTVLFVAAVMTGFYFLGEHNERTSKTPENSSTSTSLPQLDPHIAQLAEGSDWERIDSATQAPEWAGGKSFEPLVPVPQKPVPPKRTPRVAPTPNHLTKLPQLQHVSVTVAQPEPPPTPQKPLTIFVPQGTMIPCALVLTLHSGEAEAPVIGIVTEDVYHGGHLVIPSDTELHGPGTAKRRRDRVLVDGGWTLVFTSGNALTVNASALHRDYDPSQDLYGPEDGSLGLLGTLKSSVEHQELKMMASTVVGALARSQKESYQSLLGSTPDTSLENGFLEGGASVADLYAKRLHAGIEGDGRYVSVPAGTEFYLYTKEIIDPATATVGTRGKVNNDRSSTEIMEPIQQAQARAYQRLTNLNTTP